MKRQRKMLVEGIVVVLVMATLLIVMMPRFMQSQVRVKVTQSFRDLDRIQQSMNTYNQTFADDKVSAFYLQANGSVGGDPEQWPVQTSTQTDQNGFANSIKVETLSDTRKISDPFLSFMKSAPLPPLPSEFVPGTGGAVWGPMYAVKTRDSRNTAMSLGGGPFARSEHAEYAFHLFYGGYDYEGLGVAHGPLDNQSFHTVGIPDHTMFNYYVPYDPSNGMVSHGFLVAKMNPVPEAQRLDGKQPLPPEQRIRTHQYPLKTDPAWLGAAASAPVPSTSVITDPSAITEMHKHVLNSMELHMRGQFVDRWGIDYMFDRQYNIKGNVLRGTAPGGITMGEVDRFYKQSRYYRKYPMEYIFFWSQDKQRRIVQTPRIARFPWETCEERIIDATSYLTVDHALNRCYRREVSPDIPDSHLDRISRQYEFSPVDAIFPLALLPRGAQLEIQPLANGLIRVKWEDPTENEIVWKLDCLLDASRGCTAIMTLIQERMSFIPQQINRRMVERPSNMTVKATLFECGEHRSVNGVQIPKWMKVTNWTHYHDLYKGSRDVNAPGTYTGLNVPDVVGGAALPGFHQQWYMEVQAVRVNEPLAEEIFDPERQGVEYSFPAWVRTWIESEKRYREIQRSIEAGNEVVR